MSSLTVLKRWSRTSQEVTTAKAAQVRRGFTDYIMGKTCFSAVFIALLHYRVAEVPRKWAGKTSPSTWQDHLGVYHNGLRRFLLPHGFELHLCTSLACVAALTSMAQSRTSQMAGIQNYITDRYKHTGIAQWIILSACCYPVSKRTRRIRP